MKKVMSIDACVSIDSITNNQYLREQRDTALECASWVSYFQNLNADQQLNSIQIRFKIILNKC